MTYSESYRSFKSIPKWMLITLTGLSFVFFGNSISNGFSLDDELVTGISEDVLHPNVEKGIWGIPDIFTSHYVQNAKQRYGYRPITTSSFALEKSIYGPDDFDARAHFSHFINVLLYGLNGVLICILIFKILPEERAYLAFAVGLLFLVHPIHSEVVNNIKCRDELLVLFFGLFATLSLWKYNHQLQRSSVWLVVGLLMITLSALSKTNGILFIVLIPLVIYYCSKEQNTKLWKLFGGLLVLGILVVVVSRMLVPDSQIREMLYLENPLYVLNDFAHKIPMFFYCIAWYLKMLLFPYPLSYYYGYNQIPLADWSHPMVWLGFFVVVGFTALAIVRIRKKEIWAFGFLFFMLAIGSLANLFRVAPGIVAERFAHLPSLGLIFAVVYYGFKLIDKIDYSNYKKVALGGFGALFILITVYNWNRNEVWESKFTLYKNDIVHLSNSAKAHSLLSQEYKNLADNNLGDFALYKLYIDSTDTEISKGLDIYPEYANLWNNKGYIYHMISHEIDSAIVFYDKAVESNQEYDEAYYNLGNAFIDKLSGIDLLISGLSLVGDDSLGSYNLGQVNYNELDALGVSEVLILRRLDNIIKQSAQQVVESRYHLQLINSVRQMVDDVLQNSKSKELMMFPFQEYTYDKLAEVLKLVEKKNAANLLQQYLDGVKQLFVFYNQSIFQNKYGVDRTDEVTEIFSNREELREEYVSKILENFNYAIEYDGTKIHVYERFGLFLKAERKITEFVELNQKGIDNDKLLGKSQLYLNLILLFKYQKQYELALKNVDDGLLYVARESNIDGIDDYAQKRYFNIISSFKKLGMQIAETMGDEELMNRYK